MPKSEQQPFFSNEVVSMKEKALNSFDSGDMVSTKAWLDACEKFNLAKLGLLIDIDRL